MTKLTLSVEERTVRKAKELAQAHNTSVSAMFSRFVESAATGPRRGGKMGPLTRKLSGIVKQPTKKQSLAALNRKLFSDPKGLLAWGEENTRRLTGQPRI